MNIGIAIKTVRAELEISQEKLSELTGLSQTSISQIENGVKFPTKKSLGKICKALEIPEAVLYILGMDKADIPASRRKIFNDLYPDIKDLAIQILGKESERHLKKD
jgi:transcriptional regulator with XRE-family HTH domain